MSTTNKIAENYSTIGSPTTSNLSNTLTDTSSGTYGFLKYTVSGTSDGLKLYGYDFSGIPSDSEINSVTFKVKLSMAIALSGVGFNVYCYINNALKSTITHFNSTTATVKTSVVTGVSLSDLQNSKNNNYFELYIPGRYNHFVYGSEIIVDYTEPSGAQAFFNAQYKQIIGGM